MVETPCAPSLSISWALLISGPRERMGRAPSLTASSTISTARSTPKQNPYSSASKTSISRFSPVFLDFAGRVSGGLLATLFTPLFPHFVAAGNAVVDPSDFPVKTVAHLRQQRFLEIADGMRHVFGHYCVGKIANLPQSITNRGANIVNAISTFLHGKTSRLTDSSIICFTPARVG